MAGMFGWVGLASAHVAVTPGLLILGLAPWQT